MLVAGTVVKLITVITSRGRIGPLDSEAFVFEPRFCRTGEISGGCLLRMDIEVRIRGSRRSRLIARNFQAQDDQDQGTTR